MTDPEADRGLIRRRWDGRLREFVHPSDGRPATERAPGSDVAVTPGPPPPTRRGQLIPRRVRRTDARAPVVVPLLRAACDGSGACCGLYHHIPATTEDRDSVLAAFGDAWSGPVPLDEVFHPAFEGHENPLNIVSVGGSCAFREDDGRCGIHAVAGANSKPQSCLSYPAHLVACGTEWHASLRPECACIARSAIGGSPLDADPKVWVDLRATLPRVWAVPRSVAVDDERSVPRDVYVTWLRATVARLKTSFDPISALEAARLALGSLVEAPWVDLEPTDAAWTRSVAEHLGVEALEAERTFDPGSPYRRSIVWGAEASRRIADDGATAPRWSRGKSGDWARRAASVTSLLLHGHGLLERPTVDVALTDLIRLLQLARACEGLRAAETVDPRLESVTMWLFLYRNVWMEPR